MARRSIRNSLDMSIKTSLVVVVACLLLTLAPVSVLAKLRPGALEQTIDMVGRKRLPRIRALGEIDLAVTRTARRSRRCWRRGCKAWQG